MFFPSYLLRYAAILAGFGCGLMICCQTPVRYPKRFDPCGLSQRRNEGKRLIRAFADGGCFRCIMKKLTHFRRLTASGFLHTIGAFLFGKK